MGQVKAHQDLPTICDHFIPHICDSLVLPSNTTVQVSQFSLLFNNVRINNDRCGGRLFYDNVALSFDTNQVIRDIV